MRLNSLKAAALISGISLFCAAAAQAATISIIRQENAPHETEFGMAPSTSASGFSIAGAEVTANFADAPTEDLVWTPNPWEWTDPSGYTYHRADGWTNGEAIDMYMHQDGFEVTTTSLLTSMSINLAPAGAVFDTTFIFDFVSSWNSGESTPGSSFGYAFELYDDFADMAGHITASYAGVVNVAGAEAVGDLYTSLHIDFSGLEGGGVLGPISFRSDIDNLMYANDITAVPLPASALLMLLSLFGLMLMGHKQSRRSQTLAAAA